MTEWQSPSDYRRRETNGVKRLVRAVESVPAQVREATSNLLRTAGIFLTETGMRVASALRVEGDLEATGKATFSGDTTIGGDARITGTLSLPAGIIDNDALANPLTLASGWGQTSAAFGLPASTWTELASTSVTVPAGFTKMQFTAISTTDVINSEGYNNNLYARISRQINGAGEVFGSVGSSVTLLAGYAGTVVNAYVWSTDVKPGDTHRIWTEAWSAGGVALDAYNYARVTVAVIFTR